MRTLLPVRHFGQVKDGCFTAAARIAFSSLGVAFDRLIKPKYREYQLTPDNSENILMLGIAMVGVENGYAIRVHRVKPRGTELFFTEKARKLNPLTIHRLRTLASQGKLTFSEKPFSERQFLEYVRKAVADGMYGLLYVDWAKWDPANADVLGNQTHAVVAFGFEGSKIYIQDPAFSENKNPVVVDVSFLFQSLNEIELVILIGKKSLP